MTIKKDKRTREDRREYKKEYHIKHKEEEKKYRMEHKDHSREIARKYYLENIEKFKEKKKDYYRRNRDRVIAGRKKYNKEHRKEILDYHRKKKYGINNLDFNEIMDRQKGVCAICLKPETMKHQNGKIKESSVDHDHKTGKTRGLLCTKCNVAIGLMNDDSRLLKRAMNYINNKKI